MYAIQHNNGQWWTGTCWGVEQARETYPSVRSLPNQIEGLDLVVLSTRTQGGFLDARYCQKDNYAPASVVEI